MGALSGIFRDFFKTVRTSEHALIILATGMIRKNPFVKKICILGDRMDIIVYAGE